MTDACQEWIAHCIKKYPMKGSVLEVGSFDVNGNPRYHFADKERFPEYTGIDMREGPAVDKVMNVQELEFADNSIDVIVDAERLEHDNRFWLSIKELYRVLKPGGYYVVTTRSWGGMHPHAYPHDYWRFMDSGLKDLLEYGGFQCLATAYGERWAAGDKAVFAVGRKPLHKEDRQAANPFSVVILSKNGENLTRCVDAIIQHEPQLDLSRIIVIDDGLPAALPIAGLNVRQGPKPFIFARNANLGIKAANSDVILLNDDARLTTPNGFTELAKCGHYGIVSAAIDGVVGNKNQKARPGRTLRNELGMLCFMAVLIPKAVQERLGPLDERFTGYGFEDNDYSRRATAAGIRLGIYDGCVVEHGSLPSTFRTQKNITQLLKQNEQLYREKYPSPAQR